MAQSCFTNQLPIEVLREIFLFSYYNQPERPAKFLYVSRRWHTVARETRALWSTLHLHVCPNRERCTRKSINFQSEHKWEISVAIRSFSLEELLERIDRLGSSEFTLLADSCSRHGRVVFKEDLLSSSIKSLISSRCAALFVTAEFIQWDELGLLLERRALKSFNLKGYYLLGPRVIQHSFFMGFADTPLLRSISLSPWITPHITECHGLFATIHHLRLHIYDTWTPVEFGKLGTLLPVLRTLSLNGHIEPSVAQNGSFASQSLVHLEATLIPLSIFSSSVHSSLVVLFLEENGSLSAEATSLGSDMAFELPSLRCFLYIGSSCWRLEHILAPNLLILVVRTRFRPYPTSPMTGGHKLKKLLMQPKFASLDVSPRTGPFVNAFLSASRGIVDLELLLDEWALSSPIISHQLSETSESDLACPKLQNLRLIYKGTDLANLLSVSNEILRRRNDCSHISSFQSFKYKVVEGDSHLELYHGLGGFSELWERGLKDGSEEIWESERKRLISRPGWIDILE
ncbi:hypothetical protein CPB86DRAFT_877347 [Serendipita vermifera]|nr:hypothetical protein CPB86DRAFT_877347 [Serendipita vermifera]